MIKKTLSSLCFLFFFTIILGFFYPSVVFMIGKVFFSEKASGSLISYKDHIVGSSLIGQNFSQDRYFHPRPSLASQNGYDATDSNASNLCCTSSLFKEELEKKADAYRKTNLLANTTPLPIDAITSSASGLDPHISKENAYLQMPRVAKSRQLSEEVVKKLIDNHIEKPLWNLSGQKRVNVLVLNLALDVISEGKHQSP